MPLDIGSILESNGFGSSLLFASSQLSSPDRLKLMEEIQQFQMIIEEFKTANVDTIEYRFLKQLALFKTCKFNLQFR